MNKNEYDNWKLSNHYDYEKIFCNCDHCGEAIYFGEEYLSVDGFNIHDDCFYEFAKEQLFPIQKIAEEK